MKSRLFVTIAFCVSLALLLTLLPAGAVPAAAQEPEPPSPRLHEPPCPPGIPCGLEEPYGPRQKSPEGLWFTPQSARPPMETIAAQGTESPYTGPQEPPCPPGVPCGPEGPNGPWQKSPEGYWYMSEGVRPPAEASGVTALATGGPDDFGYTWDDSVPYSWIDATTGTNTGLTGTNQQVGPITMPFNFKYYGNVYNQVYVSTNGTLGFSGQLTNDSQEWIFPKPSLPNNVIAPYWAPEDASTGGIYYTSGGTAPNRWWAVEWYQVRDYCTDSRLTFEVVLFENGDIEFRYQTLYYGTCSSSWGRGMGIEDSAGWDGLQYTGAVSNNIAVHFTRPAPSARVSIYPLYQGLFTRANEIVTFQVPMRNTGELGADTYDLTSSSTWPVSLYAADGVTPLTDTDSDGAVDTGFVTQGSTVTITVKVQTPAMANMGSNNTANIIVRSSLNTAKQKTVTLQTAVPAPFAQVYRDNVDGAMSLYLVQPAGQFVRKTTANGYYGYNLAVAETPSGNFVYTWYKGRWVGSVYVYEIEYTLLNNHGETMRAVSKLTDHSGATVYTYDYPAVAVAPNGRIGVLWYRYLYNSSTSQLNYNIYFAVLDASGDLAYGPTNLTNNTVWGTWGDLNVPSFYSPHIAATGDNRFVLSWVREHQESTGWVDDIYYAVRDSSGGEVRGITKFTSDTPGWEERYSNPSLAPLIGNKALLAWCRGSDADVYYAVLDSNGNLVRAATNLVEDGTSQEDWWPDAVQLSDGKTVVAWTGGSYPNYRTRFAVLDASYNRIAGPTTLTNPAAVLGDGYISVAADAAGHAILTWMDYEWGYHPNLYYTLVDGNGNVLTPPMIFRTGQTTSPYIETSFEGYGNTSYSWTPPAGVDGYVTVTTPVSGTIGGYGAVPVSYGNMGAQTASSVVLETVLGDGLTYAADTSGLTPVVAGNSVRWSLPNLLFMDSREFLLYVQVPSATTIGTHLPVTLTLTSAGPELNPADNTAVAEVAAIPPPGGPDDFGYTWDDTVPFNWIDAKALGVNSGLYGGDVYTGPINIGFTFRFYENNYTQLYFSTKGLVSFGQGGWWFSNIAIPNPAIPNNIIVAFWDDLGMYKGNRPDAGIYIYQGGTAPNRYFVVEWFRADQYSGSGESGSGSYDLTFEVILYENGNIVMQYLNLSGYLQSATVGIEDDWGVTGLQYLYNAPGLNNNEAVHFYRPAPMARVKVYPLYQGRFTHAGATETFQVSIRNNGELGADTYDLTASSIWPVSLYTADGVTPLTDTDSDGVVDTDSVAQGSTITITVKVQTPPTAHVGDNNVATVTVRSSLDTAKSRTSTLQTAIPAPFAQVYLDYADGAMSLYLIQPIAQAVRKATGNSYYGYNIAIAETPDSNFVYAWSRGRCLDNSCNIYVDEIEYTLLNRYGETVRAVSKLTDHTGATVSTYDYPAVATSTNGRIGLLWYRELYNNSNSQSNYNIYFAVLDASGNLIYGPTNLTNNTAWGTWSDLNVPRFWSPRIAATGDNRFVLAWYREHQESAGWVDDIYYAVRDSNGSEIRAMTKFTADTPGWDEAYYYPNLAALSGNRALLTWQRSSDADIYYAVLDSSGNTVKAATNLVGDGTSQWDWESDAVQLSDGKTVVAWAGGSYPNYRIRFAVLDTSYNRIAGPTTFANPAALIGDGYVSLTTDAAGHAILTWMDYSSPYRNLYYALVDGNGNVLTPPMIFRISQASSPYIFTSSEGYGNTSYSWTPPAGVDGWVRAPSLVGTPPASIAGIQMRYGNHGATTATSVVLTATLGTGLTYVSDNSGIPPAISGNVLTWNLPDIAFLGGGQFSLRVSIPNDPIGTRYPVTLTLSSAGTEANPADNALTLEVMAARQLFLPLIMRNYR
jgi:hypothetical protein